MSIVKAFIERHSLPIYFALVFAISWGGMIIVLGPGAFTGAATPTDALLPFVFLAMFAGPSVAGLLMTGLVHGRAGYRDLLSRLLRWRVGAGWYAIALLTAPLLIAAVLLALSFASRGFLPGILESSDKASLLLVGIAAGLLTGLCEELGWTGFAVPQLRRRYGVLATGLIVGLLWGAWHFPLFSGGDLSGAVALALFLPVQLFTFLPAFRVLMVWVNDGTGSLLVVMLMHASLTASTLILQPQAVAGVTAVTYDLVLAAALWAVVIVVAAANHGHLTAPASSREVAGGGRIVSVPH